MSEDLIKRSDAIKAVWGDDINPSEDGMVFEAQSHIDRDMRLIPSADRPQGEWVWHEDEDICNCSRCDFEIDAEGCIDPTEYVEIYNYCPHCGARMKGADDD